MKPFSRKVEIRKQVPQQQQQQQQQQKQQQQSGLSYRAATKVSAKKSLLLLHFSFWNKIKGCFRKTE